MMVTAKVTITRSQYRQLCNAYINTVNMMPQLLMVTPAEDSHSPDALYRLQSALQLVEQQLREVVETTR